jgi:chromosome segregation ATPase
MIGATEKDLEL